MLEYEWMSKLWYSDELTVSLLLCLFLLKCNEGVCLSMVIQLF